ncbi:efflux RND transporter periplasmic adaptor subunit [Hydrogenophaga sp.]|uniref:efflux RND transporter periplasmic adaptor subunit n=1 Tax=Hydrogenophaga sp. TaxID=1904254 RepID=UPI0035B0B16C
MKLPRSRAAWIQWGLLAVLVVAVALGLVRALNKRATVQAQARQAAEALQQTPVYTLGTNDLVTVRSLPLTQAVAVSGSLKALQMAAIKAKVAGELQGLSKREGDPVQAGEVVGRIDSTEAQARMRQAEQQAAQALAQVAIAKRTQDNNQALVKQGFISPTALDTSTANLAAAEATHRAALAALDIARKGLQDTTLRSPLSGQVSARGAQNGERVALDARVLEVVDLSAFELEAAIAPGEAVPVAVGQPAELVVEGIAQPVKAVVSRINPSVQAGSRSVLVYLKVPAQAGMRQGLFAQGHIAVGTVTVPAVPLAAVRNDKPQPYLQVVRDSRVVHVALAAGASGLSGREPMREANGLTEGVQVLGPLAGAMRDGTPVRLPDAQPAKAAN